jgi:hypothetical protein
MDEGCSTDDNGHHTSVHQTTYVESSQPIKRTQRIRPLTHFDPPNSWGWCHLPGYAGYSQTISRSACESRGQHTASNMPLVLAGKLSTLTSRGASVRARERKHSAPSRQTGKVSGCASASTPHLADTVSGYASASTPYLADTPSVVCLPGRTHSRQTKRIRLRERKHSAPSRYCIRLRERKHSVPSRYHHDVPGHASASTPYLAGTYLPGHASLRGSAPSR